MKQRLFSIILLFAIISLAVFFRVYFPYDRVFSEPIKYAADDGVYHMRLVENELLGNHFPRRIYFDPYTYFPYGTYIHFTPLYDQLLSGFIWLIGLGNPTLELINEIAPFYPAILGSLVVFLVYFIARAVWNKEVAFLSAFLIAIFPPFLDRSLLGANDHHVAEVLFSTLTMLFLILALKSKNKEQKTENKNKTNNILETIKKEWIDNRKFWLLAILTGVSLGLYFLTWNGALLFLFIIFLFIILYYLIEYFLDNYLNYLLGMGIVIFLFGLLIIVPFFGHPDLFQARMYNIQHLAALIFGILVFVLTYLIAKFVEKINKNKWFFLVVLLLIIIFILMLTKFIFPSVFESLLQSFQAVNTSGSKYKLARTLTSEMIPLRLRGAFDNFSASFYLALVGLGIIFYNFIIKRKPEHFLIVIWTVIIILMTGIIPFWGQKRFSYYLAVNISLLVGFLVVEGFKFGWRGLRTFQRIPLEIPGIKPYLLIGNILIIFNVVFFLIFPFPLNIDNPYPKNLPAIIESAIEAAKNGPHIENDDWYKLLEWLKNNTPEPGLDYHGLYEEPDINKETGRINPYSYPEGAYGVLAKWDVGHMITYYAHRIPNANPFHQGIGIKEGENITEIGEGTFFLEIDEGKATEYLKKLKTRYIITDYLMANPDNFFKQKVKWVQGNLEGYLEDESSTARSKFDNSMIARLHILDGREDITEREVNGNKTEFYIKPLDYFRLIYESETTVVFSPYNPNDVIKAIKIFEYVKGAKITGWTLPGLEVSISTEIETNQGRKFVYQKSIKAEDGYFEFIVPYSTFGKEGRLEEETQFAVFAQPYKLKIGGWEIEINVNEEDILKGRTINI